MSLKLSTRARYGTRAALQLATTFGQGPVPVSIIAESQRVSRKYLFALLGALASSGIVRSVRGRDGGFELSRPPEQITMGEIVRCLEGPISLVECTADTTSCDWIGHCASQELWKELADALANILDNRTLADLAARRDALGDDPDAARFCDSIGIRVPPRLPQALPAISPGPEGEQPPDS